MTNRKTTRRALFMSVISLMLCCAMLVGTTFAWFTDEVTSVNNVITAGNLDVELEYAKVVNGQLSGWNTVQGADKIFDPNALWEPGRVEVVYLKVSNLGSLVLKYQLGVNVASEVPGTNVAGDSFKLSDHLVFKTVEMPNDLTTYTDREAVAAAAGTEKGLKDYNGTTTALEVGGVDYVALIVYMPETVGNEANYKTGTDVPTINLGVNLYATQKDAESDSFGPDYDEDADHKSFKVTTADELQAAIDAGETNIALVTDIDLADGEKIVVEAGKTVTINLNGKTVSGAVNKGAGAVLENKGTLTVKGGTIENTAVNGGPAISNSGNLTLEGANVVGAPIDDNDGYPSYALNTSGKLTIEEGTSVSSDRGAIQILGDGETTINGGVFTNNDISRSLTSHVVDLSDDAVNHVLTINGGTFQHLFDETSGGVVICNRTKNTIYVNGGSFSGGNYYGNDNLSDYGYGGTFSVTGGTYTAKPAEKYIASGYKAVETTNGYMVISGDVNYVADGVLKSADEKTYFLSNKAGYDWMEQQTDSFFAGKTVKLDASIDFGGATIGAIRFWNPENKTTFDGNGNTISNFVVENNEGNAGLFNGTMTVKNLVVDNANVTGQYAGVIAGNMYGDIENVTVKNSVVNGTYWQTGALVGQYNAGSITNCVVEDCTINGLAAVGALVGIVNETAGERNFVNCTVKNCEINQTGSFGSNYDEMFGVAVGLVNIDNSTVSFNECTFEGNTVKGVASDVLCGVVGSGTSVTDIAATEEGFVLAKDCVNGGLYLYDTAEYTGTELEVPAGVTAIGNYAFAYNNTIETVVLPATVTDLGRGFDSSAVKKVVLNEGLETISSRAFKSTSALVEVVIPSTVTTIADDAFQKTGLKTITIPATVEYVGAQAFGASKIETVIFEGDITIQNKAFRGCENLRTVYINGDDITFENTTGEANCWFCNSESSNPNTSEITFHVKNASVAAKVKAAMGKDIEKVEILVNGVPYEG